MWVQHTKTRVYPCFLLLPHSTSAQHPCCISQHKERWAAHATAATRQQKLPNAGTDAGTPLSLPCKQLRHTDINPHAHTTLQRAYRHSTSV